MLTRFRIALLTALALALSTLTPPVGAQVAPTNGCTTVTLSNGGAPFTRTVKYVGFPNLSTINASPCQYGVYLPAGSNANIDHVQISGVDIAAIAAYQNNNVHIDHTTIDDSVSGNPSDPAGCGSTGCDGILLISSQANIDHTTITNAGSGGLVTYAGSSVNDDHTIVTNTGQGAYGDGMDFFQSTAHVAHGQFTGQQYAGTQQTGAYFDDSTIQQFAQGTATAEYWGFAAFCTTANGSSLTTDGSYFTQNQDTAASVPSWGAGFYVDNNPGDC